MLRYFCTLLNILNFYFIVINIFNISKNFIGFTKFHYILDIEYIINGIFFLCVLTETEYCDISSLFGGILSNEIINSSISSE